MSIKISSRKAKGRKLQQWVCKQISEAIRIPYTPGNDNSLIQSRPMGQKSTDVVLRGQAQDLFPFSVECKSTEKINLYTDISQAMMNVKGESDWLLIHKRNGSSPIAILDAKAFFNIIEDIIDLKNTTNE